jgi:hypothetical protein
VTTRLFLRKQREPNGRIGGTLFGRFAFTSALSMQGNGTNNVDFWVLVFFAAPINEVAAPLGALRIP